MPTVTVTPFQVPLGHNPVTISGEGYKAKQELRVHTSMFPDGHATADANGEFSIPYVPLSGFTHVGPASVVVYSESKGKRDPAVLAMGSYEVV